MNGMMLFEQAPVHKTAQDPAKNGDQHSLMASNFSCTGFPESFRLVQL